MTVVLSIIRKVLNFITSNPSSNFLRFLSLLHINHNTLIPSYFNDQHLLIHLALILHPQIGGSDALKKIGLDYLEDDENEVDVVDDFDGNTDLGGMVDEVLGDNVDEVAEDIVEDVPKGNAGSKVDVEILDAPPPVFQTPRKKRAVRVKEKLDDSFLRRSRRISNKL